MTNPNKSNMNLDNDKMKVNWFFIQLVLLNIILIFLRIAYGNGLLGQGNFIGVLIFTIIVLTLLILLGLKKYDYFILVWLSFYFAAPIITIPNFSIGSLGLLNGIFIPLMILILFGPKSKYFLLIIALMFVSILNPGTLDLRLIISRIFEFIAPLLFFYFVVKKCKNPSLLISGAITIALINIPLAIYQVIYQPAWGSLADWRGIRIFGNLFWHNSYSVYLLPLLLVLYGYMRDKFSKWYLVFFLILLSADILTLSRAGIFSLLFGLILFEFIYTKGKKTIMKKTVLVLLIASMFLIYNTINIQDYHLRTSTIGERTGIWESVTPLINNLFLGNGLGSYEAERVNVVNSLSPHNYYLGIIFEVGILGLILVLLFLGNIFMDFRRKYKKNKTHLKSNLSSAIGIALLASLMLFSITGDAAFSQVVSLDAWIILGCLMIKKDN
jgi:O-antigen ligase